MKNWDCCRVRLPFETDLENSNPSISSKNTPLQRPTRHVEDAVEKELLWKLWWTYFFWDEKCCNHASIIEKWLWEGWELFKSNSGFSAVVLLDYYNFESWKMRCIYFKFEWLCKCSNRVMLRENAAFSVLNLVRTCHLSPENVTVTRIRVCKDCPNKTHVFRRL